MPTLLRRSCGATLAAVALAGTLLVAGSAAATTQPAVTSLSAHRAVYWGGTTVVVHGVNLTVGTQVVFGRKHSPAVRLLSATSVVATVPWHALGTVDVRVVTGGGRSSTTAADRFTFARPTLRDPIQGGLTVAEEQRAGREVVARRHGVHLARRTSRWTAAMGLTALRRAESWIGMPYAWAGGNGSGPTRGVCAHNGGDLDCHVTGFDCSGLALYSWWPYEHLVHYAATQHARAGRFHPSIGELEPGDLVFFAGYVAGGIGHVAIYAGNGMVVQAAESGTLVMRSRLADVIASSGPYRGATRPLTTGRQSAEPQVRSVTARVPAAGGTVTLTGRNLQHATSVLVGGTRLYRFVSDTAGRLTVRVPAHHAGTVTVAVSTAWGTSTGTTTYVAAPTVASLSPATVPLTGGTVTVTGSGLAATTSVTVDGDPVGFTVTSDRAVTVTVPGHAAGTVQLTVTSPFGTSAPVSVVYAAPVPSPTQSTTPMPTPTPSPSSSVPAAPTASASPSGTGTTSGTPSPSGSGAPSVSASPTSGSLPSSANPSG